MNSNPLSTSNVSRQRVVLLGAAGYVGSVLTHRMVESGRSVAVLDRLDFGVDSLRGILDQPNFELIRGDFRDRELVRRTIAGADVVVHIGAIVGDAACALDEPETVAVNYAAAVQVADDCRRLGVPRLLFASTCSVYGAADHVVDETSPLNPVSLYARTKIDAENRLLEMRDERFHPIILRLGTAFGWSPRPRFDLVVNLLTAKAHFEGRAVIFNGDQWRPFVHVRDIARSFEVAMDSPVTSISGEVFNVGANRMNRRLSDLGRVLRKRFPAARVLEETTPDRRDYRVNFSKIETRLGFRGRTSLTAGIEEMRRALESGAVADYRHGDYHNHLAVPVRVTV